MMRVFGLALSALMFLISFSAVQAAPKKAAARKADVKIEKQWGVDPESQAAQLEVCLHVLHDIYPDLVYSNPLMTYSTTEFSISEVSDGQNIVVYSKAGATVVSSNGSCKNLSKKTSSDRVAALLAGASSEVEAKIDKYSNDIKMFESAKDDSSQGDSMATNLARSQSRKKLLSSLQNNCASVANPKIAAAAKAMLLKPAGVAAPTKTSAQ